MKIRKVSIIVPIYGDIDSLIACVRSLRQFIGNHTVLLVNDIGPEADRIEKKVLLEIKGSPNFKYFRNNKNLGFVKNCNNAVFNIDKSSNDILLLNSDTVVTKGFLEEMMRVLYSSSSIAVVSPRSNNATIASIPIRLTEMTNYSDEMSRDIYEEIRNQLPLKSYIPVAHGFCMLIKRYAISKYGLFDEIYGKGYGEENDFCLRIREHGLKCALANRAYVYHARSKSFTPEQRLKLISKNSKILKKRYPDLDILMRNYIYHDISAVDWFALLFWKKRKVRKIAIDLTHMPKTHNEETRKVFHFMNAALSYSSKSYQFIIMTNPDVDEFFKFKETGFRVVYAWENDELFDVGFSPYSIQYFNNFKSLHRHCAKIAVRTDKRMTNSYFRLASILKTNDNFDYLADYNVPSELAQKDVITKLLHIADVNINTRYIEKRRVKFNQLRLKSADYI